MKVIDGKHYIDGPWCDECCGAKYIITRCGMSEKGWEYEYYLNDIGEKVICPACHGTGLKPVEEWPDAVKAEWLRKNGTYRGVDIYWASGVESWVVKKTCLSKEIPHYIRPEKIAVNSDFSAALTAAVIAVAEEERWATKSEN